jgi:hypothetical protein
MWEGVADDDAEVVRGMADEYAACGAIALSRVDSDLSMACSLPSSPSPTLLIIRRTCSTCNPCCTANFLAFASFPVETWFFAATIRLGVRLRVPMAGEETGEGMY